MLYAIVGIPLTLYALTNLGFIMATAFRFLYKYVFCGLCCLLCSMTSDDSGGEQGPSTGAKETAAAGDGAGTPGGGGAARRAVLFLRSRRGRRGRRHVDVTESEAAAAADEERNRKIGWRQRLGAVFAETVDINQVSQFAAQTIYTASICHRPR